MEERNIVRNKPILELEMLKKMYSSADANYSTISSQYEEAMKYSIPNSEWNMSSFGTINKPTNVYDSVAMIESERLARKMVNMILPTNTQWGGLKAPGEKDKNKNTIINSYGEKVYNYLISSNLNKEALGFFLNLNIGTAVMRMVFNDYDNPISLKNLNISNLRFVEDGMSRPYVVFYKYDNVEVYNLKTSVTSELNIDLEDDQKISYLEVCYPYYVEDDKLFYKYMIVKDGFSEIYLEEDLPYCPLIVCRNLKDSNNQYGVGPAVKALPNIVNNNDTVYSLKVYGKTKITPPLMYEGNKKDYEALDIVLGQLSYLGPGGQSKISSFSTSGDPNAELMNSAKDIQAIKDIFFSSYIYQGMNTGNPATAFEWQQRYREFLEVFSPNYQMIEEEFLKPIFINTLNILAYEGIDGIELEKLEAMEYRPTFKNKLTEHYTSDNIDSFNRCFSNMVQIVGDPKLALATLNLPEVSKKFIEWYDVSPVLFKEGMEETQRKIEEANFAQANPEQGGMPDAQV